MTSLNNYILIFIFLLSPGLLVGQCVSGDCENGYGVYKYKNGVYEGTFVEGNLLGKGVFTSKRGYKYDGQWNRNKKDGFAKEFIKKGGSYVGNFQNNLRHGSGEANIPNNRFMDSIVYVGQWERGSICGSGEMSYNREVKRGRAKVVEKNKLTGEFVNGIFQGRLTSPYSDELIWEPYRLKAENFKAVKNFTEKEYKKLKNLSFLDTEIVLSCSCSSGFIIFNSNAILRTDNSWWSSKIPVKTKSTILETMQKNFDIAQWYALMLKNELNKQALLCDQSSLPIIWSELLLKNKELIQEQKQYSIETAWNPLKGLLKNQKAQDKWNRKIQKNLNKQKKINTKTIEKLNKKSSKSENKNCPEKSINPEYMPIIPVSNPIVQAPNSKKEIKNNEKALEKKEKEKAQKEIKAQKALEKKEKEKAQKEIKAQKALEKKEKDDARAQQKASALVIKNQKKEARKLKRSLRSYVPKFPRPKQLE